eukprot:TRINITY_DN63483_c0_g1_i1.p1 TRINITY_DN63483_c0_g1~~TRINITY_DN63483_c0_g1_i1.p1  ORF type:complete len:210 (-),score=0.41 TRINITY_DN63483_c0_g1_i1:157-786(-)
MGMCAVTCCCPPLCGVSSSAAGIVSCIAPRVPLHKAWWISSSLVLVAGLAVYIHLTFLCRDLTAYDLGHEPKNQTGLWVNASNLTDSDRPLWFARGCDWPATGLCEDNVDRLGKRAQSDFKDQIALVNYTKVHLGVAEKVSWSLSPLDYQGGNGCWSEGSGAYFGNGIMAALLMSIGASGLLISLIILIIQRTSGECCGRPLAPDYQTA